jgi:hypothetical protein
LSAAVAEQPTVSIPQRDEIRHAQDAPQLRLWGVDLKEPELIAEYFEYRDLYGRPGALPEAKLLDFAIAQKRRQAAKKAKGK